MTLRLTVPVTIGGETVLVPPSVAVKLNDLFAAFAELERQRGYVLPRRLDRATYFRARFDDAVRV